MAKAETEELGFQTQILRALDKLPTLITFPDKTNKGRLYALLALWKRVKSIADAKGEALLGELQKEELIIDPKSIKTAGTTTLGVAGKLEVTVDVTQPRREFNLDYFAAELLKGYKVPTAVTRALYEASKRPGTTQTRTIKVKEGGVAI